MDLFPDHHNKTNIIESESHNLFSSPVYIKVMFALCSPFRVQILLKVRIILWTFNKSCFVLVEGLALMLTAAD